MSELNKSPLQSIYSEAAFAAAQNGAACWSRAFAKMSEGMMAAAKAQAALASEAFKTEQNGWLKPMSFENAAEVTQEWLSSHKARQDALLRGIRKINDDLAVCFFSAADEMVDGLKLKNGGAEPAAKIEHVKPVPPAAVAPADKKPVAA